jgi:hydroxyacylglutathione hydrolase
LNELNSRYPPIIITLKEVNCYLIKLEDGYVLIDTSFTSQRKALESRLEELGLKPGNLNLIILTHGDFDHVGNAAYLRNKYKTKIAMHSGDLGMVEHGDLFASRTSRGVIIRSIAKVVMFITRMGLKKKDRFKPDIILEEGDQFLEFSFNAKVLYLPGHSKGSIGILTPNNDLFCGDVFMNQTEPTTTSLVDNQDEFEETLEKIKNLNPRMIYPGHGKPFKAEQYFMNNV